MSLAGTSSRQADRRPGGGVSRQLISMIKVRLSSVHVVFHNCNTPTIRKPVHVLAGQNELYVYLCCFLQ